MPIRSIARFHPLCLGVALALLSSPALAGSYELTPIAFDGDVAPETGGGTYTFFYTPSSLNDAGELAFATSISGGTAFSATFVHSAGAIDARMVFGSAAPDVGGTYGADGSFPKLNRHGTVSNLKTLVGASVTHGLFTDDGVSDAARVISGPTAPETGGGTYATTIGELSLHAFLDDGRLAFISPVSGGTASNGVFVSDGVADVAVALQGDPAPSTGGAYDTFTYLAMNALGSVFFTATVSGGTTTEGLFRSHDGSDSPIALVGEVAPDSGGQTFAMFATPATSVSGHVAFLAGLAGAGAPAGIFTHVAGSTRLIALEGGVMPGTGGATATATGGLIVMDRAGRVYFSADLSGGSVASAVFEYDPATDALRPVMVDGEVVPETGGATITSFGPVSVNAAGELAMQVTLSDARVGLVLASPATVPALPGAGVIAAGLMLGIAGTLALRRRSA